jgi:hypothetical protein
MTNICIAFFKNNTKCQSCVTYELNYDNIDVELKSYLSNNNTFCKIHIKTYIDHMVKHKCVFSSVDLSNGKICSGCKIKLPNICFNSFSSCIKCRSREKKPKNNDKCVIQECKCEQIKYKLKSMNKDTINNTLTINKITKIYDTYCEKHQLQAWLNEIISNNKKPCFQYNHYGCRTILDLDHKNSSCDNCLQMIALKDREHRKNLVSKNCSTYMLSDVLQEMSINEPSNKLFNKQLDDKQISEKLNENPVIEQSSEQLNDELDENPYIEQLNNNPVIEQSSEQLDDMSIDEFNNMSSENSNDVSSKQLHDEKNKLYCTSCFKLLPINNFVSNKVNLITGHKNIFKHCNKCRVIGKKADDKRINRIRDYREYENRLEVKNRRREYRQNLKKHNPKQYKLYTILYRERLRDVLGDEKYLKLNADRMKNYLDINPHMRKKQNDKSKLSLSRLTYNYIKSASTRNIDYELSSENTTELMKNVCFYCKDINENGEKYFNGIDRIDNDVGYTIDNCVTCCKMCNVCKKNLALETFIGKVHHIISYIGLIDKKDYYPDLFKNYNNRYYNSKKFYYYEHRANKKQLKNSNFVFAVTREEFTIITSMDCYMCGKESNELHNNGIDRIDNKLGYVSGNIMPCCGNCNYIKNEYDIDKLLIKFCQIYHKRLLTDDEKEQICDKIKIHLNNKITEVNKEVQDNLNDVINMTFDMYAGVK